MKTIDLLQCERCKQNLKNFIKLQEEPVSDGVVKLLEDYTRYCENLRKMDKIMVGSNTALVC